MSNDHGNPRIAEYGKLTRFKVGGRSCPLVAQRRAAPPWSIKRAVMKIMRTEFAIDRPVTLKELLRVFCPDGRHVTGVQVVASLLVLAALDGDLGAMARVEYMMDGPAPRADEVDDQ